MKDLLNKVAAFSQAFMRDRGDVTLVGLFRREAGMGNWDLVVSAPGLTQDLESLKLIIGQLRQHLDESDLLKFSLVAVPRPEDPFVQQMEDLDIDPIMPSPEGNGDTAGKPLRLGACEINGMSFKQVILFVWQPEKKAAPSLAPA